MANFNGFILTNSGKKLLEEALTGKRLVFTKFQFGDGETDQDIRELSNLINQKEERAINQIENTGNGQVMLRVIMNNKDVEEAYEIKEVGVLARCDDGEEILYAYNRAINPDYMPIYNGKNLVEIEYANYIIISQLRDVEAIIDGNITYLTKEEANEKYVKQTQIATKDENGIVSLNMLFDYMYPIGSIYTTTNKDFDPNVLFKGTWKRFAEGRTLIGVNETDDVFKESENLGGSKTEKLTVEQMPAHAHGVHANGNHTHGIHWGGNHYHIVDDHSHWVYDHGHVMDVPFYAEQGLTGGNIASGGPNYEYTHRANVNIYAGGHWSGGSNPATHASGDHGHNMDVSGWHAHGMDTMGGNKEHNNLSPYITVYFWKRLS